jgi:hypothetical protein
MVLGGEPEVVYFDIPVPNFGFLDPDGGVFGRLS